MHAVQTISTKTKPKFKFQITFHKNKIKKHVILNINIKKTYNCNVYNQIHINQIHIQKYKMTIYLDRHSPRSIYFCFIFDLFSF